jgi:hypothetical protein
MNSILRNAATGLLIALVSSTVPARADLTVTPLRAVFTDRETGDQTISLVNSGKQPGAYRVGFIHYLQTLNRGFVEITRPTEKPGVQWADKLLRFSPQNVVLPAGTSQTVRLQVRMPPTLPPGEYRTHLLFTSLPQAAAPRVLSQRGDQKRPVRMALSTVYRLAIPVVVWHGPLSADIKLTNLAAAPAADGTGLSFTAVREGTRSVFGTVLIRFLPYRATEPVEVGRMTDLAIYLPNRAVDYKTKVVLPQTLRGQKGRLVLTFIDPYAVPQVRAEESIEIN